MDVESPSQPLMVIGYKRPDQYDKDDPVFDVISTILSGGRTGILYKEMVRDKKIALAAPAARPRFPAASIRNLFLFLCWLRRTGHTIEENEKAMLRHRSERV